MPSRWLVAREGRSDLSDIGRNDSHVVVVGAARKQDGRSMYVSRLLVALVLTIGYLRSVVDCGLDPIETVTRNTDACLN
jgi:hypothetical protein